MPILECKRRDIKNLNETEVVNMGYSIIDGILGEIVGHNGKLPEMHLDGAPSAEAMSACTDNTRINDHIDIFSKTAKIVYDLGTVTKVENLLIRGYYCPHQKNYTIGEFKVYASDNRDNLFDSDNELAHERPMDTLYFGERNNADWVYDVKGSLRYFGIEILVSNPTDDLIRLSYIGVYSKDYTEKKALTPSCFKESLLYNLEPKYITRGELFDDDRMVKVEGKKEFIFKLAETRKVKKLWIVTKGDAKISVKGFKEISQEDLPYDRKMHNLECTTGASNDTLKVLVKCKCFVDGIGASTDAFLFSVDSDDVIAPNFLSIGANILPMHFMQESINSGYNDVYWELERARILKVRPNVVRMWFQPDWLATNYDDYKNGKYDFECQKMQSVYRWLDVLKEAGSEIEFNFGWKVSSYAQEWYSLDNNNRRNSAPREIDLFAKCCGATLKELIENRGYDNIKYLTFYNEPDAQPHEEEIADFCVVGSGVERKEYWKRMMLACHKKLNELGLDYIKIWGPETCRVSKEQTEWIDFFSDVPEVDKYSVHRYVYKCNKGQTSYYDNFLRHALKTKPVVVSECGQCISMSEYLWNHSNISLFTDLTNIGVSGFLLWVLNSVYITDPCNFLMRDHFHMWDAPQVAGGIDNVREVFYEWAMLSRYIPNHSQSIRTKVLEGTDDARICAFTKDDDITILVELKKGDSPKEIEIKLKNGINKKMYKHIYRRPNCKNGSAIMPPCVAEIEVGDTIRDTTTNEYQAVVYTTIPPVAQVRVFSSELFLEPNCPYYLNAEMVDGKGEIAYEITKQVGDSFTINKLDNSVMLKEGFSNGDMCAIKAYSVENPEAYNIIIAKAR